MVNYPRKQYQTSQRISQKRIRVDGKKKHAFVSSILFARLSFTSRQLSPTSCQLLLTSRQLLLTSRQLWLTSRQLLLTSRQLVNSRWLFTNSRDLLVSSRWIIVNFKSVLTSSLWFNIPDLNLLSFMSSIQNNPSSVPRHTRSVSMIVAQSACLICTLD